MTCLERGGRWFVVASSLFKGDKHILYVFTQDREVIRRFPPLSMVIIVAMAKEPRIGDSCFFAVKSDHFPVILVDCRVLGIIR